MDFDTFMKTNIADYYELRNNALHQPTDNLKNIVTHSVMCDKLKHKRYQLHNIELLHNYPLPPL